MYISTSTVCMHIPCTISYHLLPNPKVLDPTLLLHLPLYFLLLLFYSALLFLFFFINFIISIFRYHFINTMALSPHYMPMLTWMVDEQHATVHLASLKNGVGPVLLVIINPEFLTLGRGYLLGWDEVNEFLEEAEDELLTRTNLGDG